MEGVHLDGIYMCPHKPEDYCSCRKPETGLLELAAKELVFEPEACFVIGDKASGIELGRRAGATTVLVRTGYGMREALGMSISPDYMVDGLWQAGLVIKCAVCKQHGTMVGTHAFAPAACPQSLAKNVGCHSHHRPFHSAIISNDQR
jgi:hypothetical protein